MIVGLILVFITSLLVLINPQISGMIVDEVIEGSIMKAWTFCCLL